MSRKIEVQILGDSKSLEAALGKAQAKTSRFGSALATGAKVGAAGLLGLGVAAKIGFDEMSQHLKVVAQTNAVLKSTGSAANVTAGHVDDLSRSISNYSGQDDEAVQASENLLLTFKNIHNEAGRTNDVFDQSTKAVADLAQAMGIDLQSAALQVGKALNDPEKGMKRLQRIGVQFTDSQVKLVAALVKTGRTQEAQKVILGELNQEFGGSAKAFGQTLPGQIKIAQESFRNLTGQLVTALLPALLQVASAINSLVVWMRRNQTATKVLVVAFAALSVGLIAAKAAYALANSGLIKFIKSERVAAIASRVLAGAMFLVDAALDANPVVLIIAAIVALGVALVVAYKKSKTFRAVVHSAISAVGSVVDWLVGKFETLLGAIEAVIHAISNIHLPSLPSSIGGVHIPGLSGGLLNNVAGSGGGGGGMVSTRPIHVHVMLDKREIGSAVVGFDKDYKRQNGRSAFA